MRRTALLLLALTAGGCARFLSSTVRMSSEEILLDAIVISTVFMVEHGEELGCAMAAGTCNLDEEE